MRAVVNVATGSYVKGQQRLFAALDRKSIVRFFWSQELPAGCPPHSAVPYAFKAYALKKAADEGAWTLLWADACIVPAKPLDGLWEHIERDGYWIGNNGWSNYEWTADSAYPDLGVTVEENRSIPHVVATAFGISLVHPIGKAILDEYYRLASTTRAFCGPWKNEEKLPIGPPDVRGHRHDQTALSVIAWRLGCKLTNSPDVFAYAGGQDERTVLVANGRY